MLRKTHRLGLSLILGWVFDGSSFTALAQATETDAKIAAEVSALAQWSAPVNGLVARVDFVDTWRYTGYVVLVQLRNVGATPLRVPMGNSPDSRLARLFELHKLHQKGEWQRVPWMPGEHLDGDGPEVNRGGVLYGGIASGQDFERTPVVLQPGEGAQVYLWGDRATADGGGFTEQLRIRLLLSDKQLTQLATGENGATPSKGKVSSSKGGSRLASVPDWTGEIQTPAFPVRKATRLHEYRRGSLECPTVVAPFSYSLGSPLNRDFWGPQLPALERCNAALNEAINLYEPTQMRRILESRTTENASPLARLMIASLVAPLGSESAKAFLQSRADATDFEEVREFHEALSTLLHGYGKDAPTWALVLMEKVLTDERKLTFNAERGPASGLTSASRVLEHATKDGRLAVALARTQCAGAFSVLEANFKRYPTHEGALALGLLSDLRAGPLLMDQLLRRIQSAQPRGSLAKLELDWLASALADLHIKDAAPLLMQLRPTPVVIIAVGQLGDLKARDWLQKLMEGEEASSSERRSSSQEVKSAAKIALAALEPEHRVTRFEELLKGPFADKWKEVNVVREMAALEDSQLVPLFLTLAATSQNKHVVRTSVEHLGEMRARQAVPVLLEIVNRSFDPDSETFITSYTGAKHRSNVYRALETISGQDFGDDWAQWENWWKGQPESAAR